MKKILIMLVVASFLSGCATFGNFPNLKKGESSQDDVRSMLGEPSKTRFEGEQEVWQYEFNKKNLKRTDTMQTILNLNITFKEKEVDNYDITVSKEAVSKEPMIEGPQKDMQKDRPEQPGKRFINQFDRDNDGRVSRKEFLGPARAFDRFDRNKDGYIDADEAPNGPPPSRRWNGNGDWDGYTNRSGKEVDPKFRGSIQDMMELVWQLVDTNQLVSGTITDEEHDYPKDITYDTEGIQIYHARSMPKRVKLGGNNKVIQVGMAFLSWEGDIESFKKEYQKSKGNEILGVVTHEKDFAKNPAIIEEWFKFTKSQGDGIRTVCDIISAYEKAFDVKYDENPLMFLKDVAGITASSLVSP